MKKFICTFIISLVLFAGNSVSQNNLLIGTWNKVSGPGDPTKYIFLLNSKVIIHFTANIDTADYLTLPVHNSSLRDIGLGENGVAGWRGVYQVSPDSILRIEGFWYTGQPTVPIPTVFNTPTMYVKVSVGVNRLSLEIPLSYSLYQNYPNPFNPVTNIKFDIPKSSFVKLAVYDILGKEVEVLVNEQLTAGTYGVKFDGSKLKSGVYFYKLNLSEFTETKKMVILK